MAEPSSSAATSSSPSSSSSSQRLLQGPRPAPLRVRGDSRKIRKPVRQPVIIYTVSPKVVHAEPSEFRSVVQRLTGAPSSSSPLPPPPPDTTTHAFPFFVPPPPEPQFPFQLHQHLQAAGPPHELSPAARLAAIQHAAAGDAAAGSLPLAPSSILSPVPGSLPAVPPSFFSPPAGAAGGGINLFGELISPAFLGASQMSYPSPSAAYYWDLFNHHQNP